MTAEQVIDEARGFHESFSPNIQPRAVVLQELRRAEKRFFRKMSEIAPSTVASEIVYASAEITAALDGTPLVSGESAQIPPYTALIEGVVVTPDGLFPCDFITDERSGGQNRFRVRLRDQQLYIAQPPDLQAALADPITTSPWQDVEALRITYVPEPTAVARLEDTLETPEKGRDYLVGALVEFMCTRAPKGTMEPADKALVLARGQGMQSDVLMSIEKEFGAETRWYVSKVG